MSYKRVLSLFLAAAMTFALAACGGQTAGGAAADQDQAGVAVQVREVSVERISTENRVSGKVASGDQHSIMVASAAKCTAVYVEAGDTVREGDKICTLNLDSTQSSHDAAVITHDSAVQSYEDQKKVFDEQIALYQKNLADARTLFNEQIALCQKNLADTQALFAIGAASQAEVDAAELTLLEVRSTAQQQIGSLELSLQSAIAQRDSTLAQLEAGIESSQSSLAQLDTVLENVDADGNVLAPVSGTVVSLSAVENSFVSNAMPVAVIEGDGQRKITVSVSEALVPKLAIGDEADVHISAAGVDFAGAIRSVEKAANMQTGLYTVTLSIPDDVQGLMSGMFADVTFHTDTVEDAVVVPTEAILTSNGVHHVFVLEGDVVRQTAVVTGLNSGGFTQITEGLAGGEQLVTVGQSYLSDGDTVRVVSGEAEA